MVGIVNIQLDGDQNPLADGQYGLYDVLTGHFAGELSATVHRSSFEFEESQGNRTKTHK